MVKELFGDVESRLGESPDPEEALDPVEPVDDKLFALFLTAAKISFFFAIDGGATAAFCCFLLLFRSIIGFRRIPI